MAKSKKETRIRKEKAKLVKVYANIDPGKRQVVDSLIARAAYMTVTLEDLEEELLVDGVVEAYQNGAHQSGVKKSASAEVYLSLSKILASITKQLLDLVPAGAGGSKLGDLMRDE